MNKAKEFVTENKHREWTCICGNIAEQDGFYPCNSNGDEIEPDKKSGWASLYICNRCKKIINQETLEVLGANPNGKKLF